MLDTLTKGFRNARLKLQGKTQLDEDNIAAALRDVRVSLLEADVELSVVKSFLDRVKERAIGEVVQTKVKLEIPGLPPGFQPSPADYFIKICHDELTALMGPAGAPLALDGKPAVILMVGLQGSGKTTTAGKLARRLKNDGKKPMLVAADIYRPAAIDQLMTLGRKLAVPVFSIKGMKPVDLATMAVTQARNVGRDVVIIDTAGRLAIDDALMQELEEIKARTNPAEILFVCDAMIGQDAVRTAAEFDRRLGFSGFVLTKLDGDARGGAALAIKQVTGKPVRFLGMGETLDKLEDFRPEGLADRILGFGDVVGLMKDFEKVVDTDNAEKDAARMLQGDFTFADFQKQLGMIKQMGSLRSIFEKLPGMGELMEQLPPEALDDRELVKVEAMIQSMTRQERNRPDLIDKSRMLRIAKGSGRTLPEVEALMQRFMGTRQMMANLGSTGMFGGMPGLGGGTNGGRVGLAPGQGRAQRRQSGKEGGPPAFPALGTAAPVASVEDKLRAAREARDRRKQRNRSSRNDED
jgi:signal recognition particle subunit SRP54